MTAAAYSSVPNSQSGDDYRFLDFYPTPDSYLSLVMYDNLPPRLRVFSKMPTPGQLFRPPLLFGTEEYLTICDVVKVHFLNFTVNIQ